ncbi:monovalent cation:proton antiporter family protein [Atopomonas sediminilitoris]|uniref:monovalent cation:proton antiporter family protein n=1 Tax=Atopomonas sediminilitoris TaxID=2919919 RepID=UPI001F4EEAF7|nr:monovalent cation:proton antiporter family protein [Atopomonas sediminilitoris]MCJ8170871.1 cation:proton antiporter [Atopomonas sediminilitoris]
MFADLLIIFLASLAFIAVFRRLHLPPILGYLFVGVLLGPSAIGVVGGSHDLTFLAEFGVVFLLFTLGLEFSLPRMLALRSMVFGLGSMQFAFTALVLFGVLLLTSISLEAAFILATGLALSSTAIVLKELTSLGQTLTPHGQRAIGVLLFQDMVAVLLLVMIPVLGGNGEQAWYVDMLLALGKTALLFFGLMAVSRWVLPRLFHEIAAAKQPELFVLMALVIVLLAAWLTHLLHLSMALGAFIAGMMLGESHYRHQIEADIRPFRDVLLGLFFVSVGLLVDIHVLWEQLPLVLALTFALVIIKGLIVFALVKYRSGNLTIAWRTALALAQGGEFCFALLTLAFAHQLIDQELVSLVISVTVCSMVLTPLLMRGVPTLMARLQREAREESQLEEIAAAHAEDENHVIVCGYGRVGQAVGRFLRREEFAYVALDDDPVRVREAGAGGNHVHFGDCRRHDMLKAVGIERARMVVVAVDNGEHSLQILRAVRELDSKIPVLIRTRDDSMLEAMQEAGATEVIPEQLESSLMLASHVLVLLGMREKQVHHLMDEVRGERYKLLHGFYHGNQPNLLEAHGHDRVLLHATVLTKSAYARGKTLAELELQDFDIELQHIRRGDEELTPEPDEILRSGDALVFSGGVEAIEAAEARILGDMT